MSLPSVSGKSPTKGKAASLCQASTAYRKKSGTLTLTRTALVWQLQGAIDAELTFENARLNSLFMSKEGGAKVVMKVGVLNIVGGSNEESFNFTFTSGASAVSDREHFKREISSIIANNRQQQHANVPSLPPNVGSSGAAIHSTVQNGSSSTSFNGLPSPAQAAANARSVLTQSVTSGAALATPASPSTAPLSGTTVNGPMAMAAAARVDAVKDWNVRSRLLKKNAELNALHTELVRTGQISDDEFWEGREHMLLAEATVSGQVSGRSAQMVDPRPEQTDSGEVKIKLSSQLIKDIFDQYPIVARAYSETVPEQLGEGDFWQRYFHSKLFDRHRASGRGAGLSGAGGPVKDDVIFDKYLEDEDDDLEPKNLRDDDVYRLLDLAATEEDHGDTGNIKDFTMRAGAQRKSLPLMRRFNEHSERLLAQALGANDRSNRTAISLDGGNAGARRYYDDIILEDLQGEDRDEAIPLDVRDRENAYEGTFNSQNDATEKASASDLTKRKYSEAEASEILSDSRKRLKSWQPDLARFHFSRTAAGRALEALQTNIANRLANNSSSSSSATTNAKLFPEPVLRAMISCQAAANEFLRHYWSAVLPPRSDDISAAAMATPQQKVAKAQRMVEYLERTQLRVDTVVADAHQQQNSADHEAVREALQPCLLAVNRAIAHYKSRVKGKGA